MYFQILAHFISKIEEEKKMQFCAYLVVYVLLLHTCLFFLAP